MTHKNGLIVFFKYPQPGKVKTRLGKTIGHPEAARIYKQLVEHLLSNTLTETLPCDVHFFIDNKINLKNAELWLAPKHPIQIQDGETLGNRMQNAFKVLFNKGYRRVVIIGTDSPKLSQHLINDSIKALKDVDFVLGPALDGGYYLLGMNSVDINIFKNVEWSTSTVLDQTIKNIRTHKKSHLLLKPLSDIDTLEDLKRENFGNYSSL